MKTKIYLLGVIINLFLIVKPSLDEIKFLFGCSYIASGENEI